jgi:hypothetical protein
MMPPASAAWLAGPLPWCAVCDTTPPAPIPTPRMALDRPAHVTTTAGEL